MPPQVILAIAVGLVMFIGLSSPVSVCMDDDEAMEAASQYYQGVSTLQ